MDPILLPLWQATDEVERERIIEELLMIHAAPIIRLTLRQRFGLYVNARGENAAQQEAEDLYQEVLIKILHSLRDLSNTTSTPNINNLKQYIARIVRNVRFDHLRASAPIRARLKKIIRDLLERHESFANWLSGGENLCGFSVWRESSKSLLAERRLADLVEQEGSIYVASKARNTRNRNDLSHVLADIFEKVGGPIELDSLVGVLSGVLDLKDQQLASLDGAAGYKWEAKVAHTVHYESQLEMREILGDLWAEILKLPPLQRDTICFGFADSNGEDLVTLLLGAKVVAYHELARQLGRSTTEINNLRTEIPLSNHALGVLLGATPAQIYKWRFLALGKLREALKTAQPEK